MPSVQLLFRNQFSLSYKIAEKLLHFILFLSNAGMSTVHEAITAHHCGIKVLAVSLITNICVVEKQNSRTNKRNNNNDSKEKINLETEVLEAANSRKHHFRRFMIEIVGRINNIISTRMQEIT